MGRKDILMDWVREALAANGGSATLVDVARHIWSNHETELRQAGDLFFTWQYDMRWAAMRLRKLGKMAPEDGSRSGLWSLLR